MVFSDDDYKCFSWKEITVKCFIFIENSTIVNGKIVNIRQFLKEKTDKLNIHCLNKIEKHWRFFEARAAEMKRVLLTLAKLKTMKW
jgi:hypothetical protein